MISKTLKLKGDIMVKFSATLFFVLAFCVCAGAVDAPFTAKEFLNQARTNEPMFCGIAFKQGELTDLNNLSLFQGTTELAAQFDRLVQFEDGSFQWVLCDFVDNFTAGEEKSYTVKTTGPPASLAGFASTGAASSKSPA